MRRRTKRKLELWMTVLILAGSFYIGRLGAQMMELHERVTTAASNAVMTQTEAGEAAQTEDTDSDTIAETSGLEGKIVNWETKSRGEDSTAEGGIIDWENGMTLEPDEDSGSAYSDFLAGKTIVVDPGHGGMDSGKVGINDVLEKDLNLEIAQKLRTQLENAGTVVIMTRESDAGLYDESESNKKQQDMKRRVELMNGSDADLAVSIHQNSYSEEYVCGPQVFYYETSESAKQLAQILQETLNAELQIQRPREIKANTTYYILRKTSLPTVIVECGFLSNTEEADKLTQDTYQEQIAEAICEGIAEYFSAEGA